jgi:hypothetical protein
VFSSPVPRTFCADHGEHVPYHALRPAGDRAGPFRDARLHFYSSSDQLVTALVPYAVAGEEERALAEGYNGLRIAGDARFLTAGDWSTFMEYEHAATSR